MVYGQNLPQEPLSSDQLISRNLHAEILVWFWMGTSWCHFWLQRVSN